MEQSKIYAFILKRYITQILEVSAKCEDVKTPELGKFVACAVFDNLIKHNNPLETISEVKRFLKKELQTSLKTIHFLTDKEMAIKIVDIENKNFLKNKKVDSYFLQIANGAGFSPIEYAEHVHECALEYINYLTDKSVSEQTKMEFESEFKNLHYGFECNLIDDKAARRKIAK